MGVIKEGTRDSMMDAMARSERCIAYSRGCSIITTIITIALKWYLLLLSPSCHKAVDALLLRGDLLQKGRSSTGALRYDVPQSIYHRSQILYRYPRQLHVE